MTELSSNLTNEQEMKQRKLIEIEMNLIVEHEYYTFVQFACWYMMWTQLYMLGCEKQFLIYHWTGHWTTKITRKNSHIAIHLLDMKWLCSTKNM